MVGTVAVPLTEWLGTRSPAQLAALLTARPDAAAPPVPRHLRELAERLDIVSSVGDALHRLPAPALQVIEVLQLLGPGAGDRVGLADWLGCRPDDPALATTLELLATRALVWPDGDALAMARPLYTAFRHPLQLGAPAAALLSRYPLEHLRPIAHALGLPTPGRKPDLVARIAALLGDADRVRELVAGADATTRARLHQLATHGPAATTSAWYGHHPPDPELRWAAGRGLVVADSWGVPQVPREAAVALRGPGWHAPFTPQPPIPPLAALPDDEAVAREAAAAGGTAVTQLTALLEEVAGTPPALLKAGGVGVKELRRLAKAVDLAEADVRLWLELAYEAELVAPVRDPAGAPRSARRRGGAPSGTARLLPATAYDEWAAAEPGDRLGVLLPVWRDLPVAPLLPPGEGEPTSPPALVRDHTGQIAAAVRRELLVLARDLPEGQGVAGESGLADAVSWHRPLLLGQHPDADRLATALWREAQRLGVVAHGALTPLGRALLRDGADHPDDVAATARALLPPATTAAVFQADLTAVVPGTPARPLSTLLDAVADRESRGGAVTWRFTPGSVRRALDAGYRGPDLVAALRERAVGGALPQPLTYLVGDVARRHGAVRVRTVACVLRAEDPALLAELAGARALRPLQLSTIAPTVLGSAVPVAETLAALRAAGYAPVAESADGVPQLERVEPQRADTSRRPGRPRPRSGTREPDPEPEPAVDAPALAARLLATPVPVPAPRHGSRVWELERQLDARELPGPPDGDEVDDADVDGVAEVEEVEVTATLAERAGQLAPGERLLLAHAIEAGQPVTIGYTNGQGNHTTRVIDSVELTGAHLLAWCHLRDDERIFSLHRIDMVAPAP